jgi:hypothetical protein
MPLNTVYSGVSPPVAGASPSAASCGVFPFPGGAAKDGTAQRAVMAQASRASFIILDYRMRSAVISCAGDEGARGSKG